MKTRRWLIPVVAALVLILTAPVMTAFASDETPLSCVLSLAVVNPGTDVVKGNKIAVSGQQAMGLLDCNVDSLDGVFATAHGSKVKFKDDGSFKGKIEGTFTLATWGGDTLTGELDADVSGVMAVPGNHLTSYFEAISGEWELDSGVEGEGSFYIELTPVDVTGDGVPDTLGGVGSLTGEVDLVANNDD